MAELRHQHQQQQQHNPSNHHQQHQYEFLPLCDVLFNIISLASYFCDIVFDFAMAYALAHHPETPGLLFPLSLVLIVASLVVSQIMSVKWYLWGPRGKLRRCCISDEQHDGERTSNWTLGYVLLVHTTQMGVLWRYFKLFIPVELAHVKHEVRELCILRLIHGFCEAGPMLLLQVYLLAVSLYPHGFEAAPVEYESADAATKLAKLTLVSAGLSLWSVCWAVASFSKGAARLRNLERLVLTWLGVLAQLAWRLCTVSARVGALIAYASVYGAEWLLVVVALHWLSMLTWLLLTPDGLFRADENLPLLRKVFVASMMAFVYVFSYVNLHETNHRQKMLIFYSVMFLENSLLVGVWAVGVNRNELYRNVRPVSLMLTLLGLFFGGLCFMGLYYRYFHVRRLRYEAGGRMNGTNANSLSCQNAFQEKHINGFDDKQNNAMDTRKVKLSNGGIPGVFNCRFANPTVTNPNRKKKKPTSFVPPPTQPQANIIAMTSLSENNKWVNGDENAPQLIPFWKKPLPVPSVNNDNNTRRDKVDTDMTVGGSLNVNLIHEKLREKKQQQLRELRAIQEEIKEGKLVPPPSTSSFASSNPSASNQKPPPNTKLHSTSNATVAHQNCGAGGSSVLTSWPPVKMHCLMPPPPSSSYYPTGHPATPGNILPNKCAGNPEILLAPRCLPHHYSHWNPPVVENHRLCNSNQNGLEETCREEGPGDEELSDFEGSQFSLPRSYTLPREFRYQNKINDRSKFTGSRHYLPSTNSSDGDVDSQEETDSELQVRGRPPVQGCVNRRKLYAQHHDQDKIELNNSRSSHSVQAPLSYGVLRSNQLVRTKTKPETRL
ncbi:uncharacterized protein LOC106640415 [Copidosoma floridanum]|uniref:uncharacterized protein LOC106640415 n=1 Tax=Copidosoma floridanum TaxID=29053 RepID=UPI0006C99CB2|nr:uncharacterized protein LOC106640415 [Copidosoma floridanum]